VQSQPVQSQPEQNPTQPAKEADRAAEARPEPAVPIAVVRQVQPGIPEGIRARINDRIVIPVKVGVSERGQVVSAVAESQPNDGIHRYLAEQAQKAVRKWRFSPARAKSGERVASSKTVDVVFTP
jgi:hypothetical protein